MDVRFVTVKELYRNREEYIGKKVTVGGWVRSIRDSKTFGFLVLHDGTFFETLQVVFADKLDNFADICKFNVGSAVREVIIHRLVIMRVSVRVIIV